VIVILNGAFGVGKTTTAKRLVTALPNAMIYDPEIIGFFIKRLNRALPMRGDGTGDYQDIVRWRTLTVTAARWLRRCSRRTLIVPMTLAWPAYYQEIVAGLRQIDPDLHHFCLIASLPTIQQRLLDRGDAPGGWTFQQTLRCVETLQADQYALHIDTERHNVEQVVELILRQLGR
jgi:chloramphenicol 3-O-phosphotransferase